MDKCDKFDFNNPSITKFKFSIGTTVNKRAGYLFPGIIVSAFKTLRGENRYVVEMKTYGLLHIFNEDQLMEVDI